MTGVSERGSLSHLSRVALRSAEALGARDVSELIEHLYTYNSAPSTDSWESRFSDVETVRRELGLISGGHLALMLDAYWVQVHEEAAGGWLSWNRPTRYEWLAGSGSGAEFKLYLSPAIEALPLAVGALIETISLTPATSFKVGCEAADLVRPDKIVVYFQTMPDLADSARRLADRLEGVPPQGVPFTAEIAGDGLLSWGVDPPPSARALGEPDRSWREWVCYQLALGLVEADREESSAEPAWQQALERLRRRGVDTDRWLPPPSSWGSALQ